MRSILIVDDSTVSLKILNNMLCGEYEVEQARDGARAIEILKERGDSLSAVLLDIVMPRLSGYSVLEYIAGDEKLSKIPVIMLTSAGDDEAELRALTLGAHDFILKPYSPQIIRKRLENTIRLRESVFEAAAARLDALTGLLSREAFFEKARVLIDSEKPGHYVMACLDINGFKVVNDQYGTQKGDEILRLVGEMLRRGFSGNGGIVSRIMADNFAVLYPSSVSENELSEIRSSVSYTDGSLLPLSFTVGRYIITDKTLGVSAMYDRAAMAMDSVKGRADRNIGVYDESMRRKILNEQEIISHMHSAFSGGEFEAWYQPQYNHVSGALIGAEALIRWRRGGIIVSPNDFIPIFERNGFIYEIDKFIWEEACKSLAKWQSEGFSVPPVSVNISRYDLLRGDLIDIITGLIDKYALSPDMLRLEITESAFVKNTKAMVKIVKKLIALGFTVEIDDFGSGYSSLNTLKDVPASVLKLDMRFLEKSKNTGRGGNILQSVVRMAKWLGMSVIAEGVETAQQADFLKTIGCSYIQGYLYAKPMTAAEYEILIKNSDSEKKMLSMESIKTLDNERFWDPNSMDTLIFNSYIGAACIFEYHGGRSEMLRVNDKYAQELSRGGKEISLQEALSFSAEELFDSENLQNFHALIRAAVETGGEETGEFVCNFKNSGEAVYLRSTLRVIAASGDRYLIYCVNENITAQRRAESAGRESAAMLSAIMDNAGSGITSASYIGGGMRLLFANDRYYELLGYTREQYKNEIGDKIHLTVLEEDRGIMRDLLHACLSEKRSGSAEFRAKKRSGETVYLRTVMSRAKNDNNKEPAIIGVYSDISGEKLAEKNLRERDSQLSFLNEIAHCLLSGRDADKSISEALSKALRHFGGKKAYIFEADYKNNILKNTYEVCAEGTKPRKAELQRVPMKIGQIWFDEFSKSPIIIAKNPYEANLREEMKDMLLKYGASSLIAVAMKANGRLLGFMGIDDPCENLENADRLFAMGDYIRAVLQMRDMFSEIEGGYKLFGNVLSDMPGGLIRMKVRGDGTVYPVFINEGFCRLVNLDKEKIIKLYADDPCSGVHPDDTDKAAAALQSALTNGFVKNARYRMLGGDGKYKELLINSRENKDESGDSYVNIYYCDIPDEERTENRRRELLDTLPYAAGVYEYKNGKLCEIYQNDAFKKLVFGGESGDLSGLSAFAPKDRERISSLVSNSPKGSHREETVVNLLSLGEYRKFRMNLSTERFEDGSISLLAVYTPLSGENPERSGSLSTPDAPLPDKSIKSAETVSAGKSFPEKQELEKALAECERLLFDASNGKYSRITKLSMKTGKIESVHFEKGRPKYTPINLTHKEYYDFCVSNVNPDDREDVLRKTYYGDFSKIKSGAPSVYTYRGIDGNEATRWFTTTISAAENSDYITSFTTDITAEITEHEHLRDLGEHDGLTDLFNTAKLEKMKRTEYLSLSSCGVVFFDVNLLKETNDSRGHETGNELLRRVADSIRSVTNRRVHAYRFGGDEFLLVMCGGDREELSKIISMWSLRLRLFSRDSDLPCSVAYGCAFSNSPFSLEALIEEADREMYINKRKMKEEMKK